MGRRRARRRRERERARRPPAPPRSPVRRIAFVAGGVALVVGGVLLLAAGGTSTRLPRVAGIMIVVGLVLAGVGIVGA
jgi:fatty acid desaturase